MARDENPTCRACLLASLPLEAVLVVDEAQAEPLVVALRPLEVVAEAPGGGGGRAHVRMRHVGGFVL